MRISREQMKSARFTDNLREILKKCLKFSTFGYRGAMRGDCCRDVLKKPVEIVCRRRGWGWGDPREHTFPSCRSR